jgi:hypothetical protein
VSSLQQAVFWRRIATSGKSIEVMATNASPPGGSMAPQYFVWFSSNECSRSLFIPLLLLNFNLLLSEYRFRSALSSQIDI